jgi:hypothetical protein
MSLKNRFAKKVQSESKFDCPRYIPKSDSDKRCRHYQEGGSCVLPDETQCVEWLKVNPQTDLLGYPLSASSSPPQRRRHAATPTPPPPTPPWARAAWKPLSGFSPELIESFKQMQTEICFTSDTGQFWLVPSYRDRSRGEITPEHLALICNVLMAFPGATVVAFENIPQKKENSDE